MINTPTTLWTNQIKLGKRKDDGKFIWLYAPKFNGTWRLGYGNFGNGTENEHSNLYRCTQGRNISMHDALLTDYDLNPKIKENLWVFCELTAKIYELKITAEALKRGDAYDPISPNRDVILGIVTRLNDIEIPKCLDSLYSLFN